MQRIFLLHLALLLFTYQSSAQEVRVSLKPEMISNEVAWAHAKGLVDEQDSIGDPPKNAAVKPWKIEWGHAKEFPESAVLDLGMEYPLSSLWVYDVNDIGVLEISAGALGRWEKVSEYKTDAYNQWVRVPLDVNTRCLRLTRKSPGCQIGEIALYAYTAEAWAKVQEQKRQQTVAAQQRREALARAQAEASTRPLVDLGPVFGKLPLVDEIICANGKAEHMFSEFPPGASRVESILGRAYRVIKPQGTEASFISWRLGRYKLLKPGSAYLLTIEYPEDAPRSMIVLNGGCETARGFYTGSCVGDALRAKYVWSNPESLRIPVSGKHEVWKQLFYLHDRFPERAFIRGAGPQILTSEDGFPVTIAQFSRENDPPSQGIAVSKISLYEVPDPARLKMHGNLPPADLPRRHIFWREEMADGVIEGAKENERGIGSAINWYRYKAGLMKFLGVNTFTKDLLEFGACQHWDSTPGGGNDWVFFNERQKDLWAGIVKLMGEEGFSVLPYYEYSGSRGYHGLGNQRRARPLTRDDAFTHISWIESANADLTDPDTIVDFKKMLDLTVVRYKTQAAFLGAWIRPRSQLPIGFGDATRKRFAEDTNARQPVSRQQLVTDKALRQKYYTWWLGKRRAFLEAMREHLRTAGVGPDPIVLFTADASEPGVGFPSWDPKLVTDDAAGSNDWLKLANAGKDRPVTAVALQEVLTQDLYLKALLSPPLDWGGWEPSHASPAADPDNYRAIPGVLMTHGFNRSYTTASPKTLELFCGASGLALVRHHALNENMLFDKGGRDLLGYVVADMERAGPYCMQAEALAMANGDPRYLGYLVGSSFNRGFPEYVRDFNAVFLSLPALPSRRLEGVSSHPAVVVKAIDAGKHGSWFIVVNTSSAPRKNISIRIPARGTFKDSATGNPLPISSGNVLMNLQPYQIRGLVVTEASNQ